MNNIRKPDNSSFVSVADILGKYEKEPDRHISREFQQYGYELAESLGDLKHKALYIKLAKETPRGLIESARTFVLDAANAKSKAKLFMWKLSQLKASKTTNQKEIKK